MPQPDYHTTTKSSTAPISGLSMFGGKFARQLLFAVGLVLATFVAYLPAIDGDFIWDDDAWTTVISGLLHDSSGLVTMWTNATALQQYYPLTGTSFWLDYQFWGFSPMAYHLENVLLHVIASILFWRLLRALELPGAWFAAAIFALHPVMVESAGWITERKNVLSLVFYLGAFLAYGRFCAFWNGTGISEVNRQMHGGREWSIYASAFLLFVAAMLSKSTAFSFPAAVLVVCWWKRGRIRFRADVLPSLPFFAVAIGLGLVIAWLETHHLSAKGPGFEITFPERCLIAGRAFWFYVGKLLWPTGLCFLYPRWHPDVTSWWQWLYPSCAVGALLSLWLARGRIGRGPASAAFFFVGTLFPVLGFMNAYGMRYAFVWDHWVYLSSLGLIAMFAALLARLAEVLAKPAVAGVVAAGMLAALGLLTWRQGAQYKNVETLWHATLLKNPDAFLAHNQVGLTLLGEEKIDEAIAHFEKALDLFPPFAEAHSNLGNARFRQGRRAEALSHFQEAVRLDPKLATAHSNMGFALVENGQLDEAIVHLRKACEIRPDIAVMRYNLASALLKRGEAKEAIEQFQSALQIRPDYAEACCDLGVAFCETGREAQAMEHFQAAVVLDPKTAVRLSNYADVLRGKGRPKEAMLLYQWATEAEPSNPYFLNNLAWVLATCGDPSLRDGARAVEAGERANGLVGGQNALILGTLGAAYAEAGLFSNAMVVVRQAMVLANAQTNFQHASILEAHLKSYQAGIPIREATIAESHGTDKSKQ